MISKINVRHDILARFGMVQSAARVVNKFWAVGMSSIQSVPHYPRPCGMETAPTIVHQICSSVKMPPFPSRGHDLNKLDKEWTGLTRFTGLFRRYR